MRWLLVVGLVGCGSGADKPVVTAPIANAPDATSVANRRTQARELELGTRGTRDYRQAAAIYDELCADGCGDHESCRELIDLAIHDRTLHERRQGRVRGGGAAHRNSELPDLVQSSDGGVAAEVSIACGGAHRRGL